MTQVVRPYVRFWYGSYGFQSQADHISHRLPTTCHRCNFKEWALAQSRGDGHRSLVTPEKVLSEYNEDLICFEKCKISFVLAIVRKVNKISTYC